ncbi:hypothetical protein PSCICO_17420 [Pseudomonas cichorii]|nr:hypothetical protein PSCICO_17420 [Pseudomonas cichorii]
MLDLGACRLPVDYIAKSRLRHPLAFEVKEPRRPALLSSVYKLRVARKWKSFANSVSDEPLSIAIGQNSDQSPS